MEIDFSGTESISKKTFENDSVTHAPAKGISFTLGGRGRAYRACRRRSEARCKIRKIEAGYLKL